MKNNGNKQNRNDRLVGSDKILWGLIAFGGWILFKVAANAVRDLG